MTNIQLLFDRQDRHYHFGEQVTGKVVLEGTSHLELSDLRGEYGWRTHGRGSSDSGDKFPVSWGMADLPDLQPGQPTEIPFSFKLSRGRATYHGHDLNIDWYVTITVITGSGSVVKTKQDFLLDGGHPVTGPELDGQQGQQNAFPAGSAAETSDSMVFSEVEGTAPKLSSSWRGTKLALAPISLITLIAVALLSYPQAPQLYGTRLAILVIVAGLAILFAAVHWIFRLVSSSRLEMNELWLHPDVIGPGGRGICHFRLLIKKPVFIDDIRLSIYAEEHTTQDQGTSPVTFSRIVREKGFACHFGKDLPPGQWISMDCPVPIDVDAPSTFVAENNSLDWHVKVQVVLKGWPDWSETIPLTVLP